MRSFAHKFALLFLLSFVFLTSCKQVTITTVLNSDASFQRIISVSGDSSGAGDTVYPFPQDGSWEMMSHKEGEDYTYIIKKDFTDVNELNKELAYQEDTVKVNALAQLDKKFRWFYSYYRYEETFYKFFPFTGADIEDYVTKDELETYYAGKDSTDIEDRMEDYAAHAMFEEFYIALVSAVERSPLGINKEGLDQKKDELYLKVADWDFLCDEDINVVSYILRSCDDVYQLPGSFVSLAGELQDINQKYEAYISFISDIIGEGYRVEVQVPGRVIDTNANYSIDDREVAWEFEADHFHYRDFVMWVESRRLNPIPTSLTALFVLAGLILLWFSRRRAYRQKLAANGIAWEDRKRLVLRWWLSVILIILGLALAGWFGWIYFVFNADPVFLFLDIFNASPQENGWFISMIVLGILIVLFGSYQLVLYFKLKKKK